VTWLLCILAAYLVGAIPFGVLIARSRGIDIRQHGSKNIGATNVGRVLGRRLGILCFVLDVLKGAAPVLAAGIINHVIGHDAQHLSQPQMWLWMAVAAVAVLGHMYSPYIGFVGGKGVATGFGAILAMYPLLTWPAIAAVVVWYLVLRLTRYVSLSSILAALSLPVSSLISAIPAHAQRQPLQHTIDHVAHAAPPIIGAAAIALLVVWKHRSNIRRITRGEEPKVGGKARRGDLHASDASG
jgi:acyl phosphate:glycerol-3-phosphate acyltransferase